MINLGILLGLLLLGAVTTLAVAIARPQHTLPAALGGLALFCFAWLIARASLPLSLTVGAGATVWPVWSWQVGPLSWTISLAILLLSLGALALEAQRKVNGARPLDSALLQLLTVVTLVACWSGSLATHVMTWTLLAVVWVAGMALSAPDGEQRPSSLSWRAAWTFAGVLLLWLAAAAAGPAAEMSGISGWSTLTRSLVLLAATFQLGVYPFHRWRLIGWEMPPARAAMLHSAPAAAGAVLLARLEAGSEIGLAFALPFTLLGLLALLAGARNAWTASDTRAALPLALIQAQTGLVVLAGVWAGPQAVVAETVVLLLGGGLLLLARDHEEPSALGRVPQPGMLIAVAALAALPLTAGFTGHSALYAAWLDQGRWLLVLVTAFLYLPLLTAVMMVHLPPGGRTGTEEKGQPPAPDLPRLLALLIPALGLFSIATLGQISPFVWLAIFLPAALALLLTWRLRETAELSQTLREALTIPLPAGPSWRGPRRVTGIVSAAAREALVILEGEGGLLWLLLFVLLLYFVQ